MFSVWRDSGLLRGLGQALTAVLVAATFVLLPTSTPEAQASGVLADGSNSVVDYALDIDGSVVSVSSAVIPEGSNDPFTVEFWFRASSTGSNILLSQGDGTGTYYVKQGGGSLVVHHNGLELNTGYKLQPNAWTHFAHTVDPSDSSSGSKVYVDGGLITESSGVRLGYPTVGGDHGLHVGSLSRSGLEQFDGLIDQVKIWSGVLDSSEIALSMHALGTPTGAGGLIAHFDFNEGSGTNVNDRIGTADLTINQSGSFLDVKQTTSVAGGDTVVTFPRTYLPGVGGWQPPTGVATLTTLVVGGGGGGGGTGGRAFSGGGGAGGVATLTDVEHEIGSIYEVTVGLGGRGGSATARANPQDRPQNGQGSKFGSVVSASGGGSGGHALITSPYNDDVSRPGLGGGGGAQAGSHDGGDPLNGFSGGNGFGFSSADPQAAGGGAGATGNGVSAISGVAGAGGPGLGSSIAGTDATYGGGGGGGKRTATGSAGNGGVGGGGAGGRVAAGADGGSNLGGGGGGAGGFELRGGNGGSGVVIVRYTPTTDNASVIGATDLVTGTNIIPTANNVLFSAEAWVYPTDLTGWRGILNQSPSLRDGLQRTFLGTQDGVINFGANAGPFINTGYTIQANQWTHIAVVVSGSGASGVVDIYVNGQLISNTTSYNRANTTGSVFHLGGTHVTSEYWLGQIDQVKIWQGALSAGDVAKSMHTYSSSGIASASLQSLYDFNEFNQGVELNRVTNQLALSVTSSVTATNYTSSAIAETGNASPQDVYFKFKRSYLTASGGWVPTGNLSRVSTVVVGGGGAGGFAEQYSAGGGGGGQVVTQSGLSIAGGTAVPIKVGQGGVSATSNFSPSGPLFPTAGQQSTLSLASPISAAGGGEGASGNGSLTPFKVDATNGFFTGGGGGSQAGSGKLATAGAGTGFSGGAAQDDVGLNITTQAGGGGAGAASNGFAGSTTAGGNGGQGVTVASLGQSFGGGGGGGKRSTGTAGTGGSGGGAGGVSSAGSNALANSGGGGGGAGGNQVLGGHGGSGVVILSYSLTPDAPTSLIATQSTSHATVNLSWAAPSYTGNSSITDYDIEYKPAGGSWTSYSDGVSTATTAAVQLPQQCIAHEFRVIAKNSNFSSVASATASATPVWGTFGSLTGVQIGSTNSECVVKFTSTASATTWTPPAGTDTVRALVVAGGGGGGSWVGAGGGAGGMTESGSLSVAGLQLSIEVGDGGAGSRLQNPVSTLGTNGGPSTINAGGQPLLSALGGGRGADWSNGGSPGVGGSGGGGNGSGSTNQNWAGASGTSGQGNAGGNGEPSNQWAAGGGGGAGGVGGTGLGLRAGDGGIGLQSDITGVNTYYAGGGGGGYHGNNAGSPLLLSIANGDAENSAGDGGLGGGGAGGQFTDYNLSEVVVGGNGVDGLGGGGGGAGKQGNESSIGGDGGSGVVILRQLTVATPLVTTQPASSSAEPGQTKTLAVTATGNGTLSYQWQSSTDGSSWTNVGGNASSFTTGALALSDNGIQYRVIVTNTLNDQSSVVTSSVAVISVVGVTIGTGLCQTMVSNDSGATVSQTAAGGCLLEFTTPGNNMWFVPNNVSSVEALVVGGGGGGASGRGGTWYGGGGGGGGGEYQKVTLPVTTSQQIPLTVGAGGTGGAFTSSGSVNNGGDGQASSFSVSGAVATGGSGGQGSTTLGFGGFGGSGATGTGVAGSSGGDGSDGMAFQAYQRPTDGGAAKLTTLGGEQFCLGGGGAGGNRGAEATHFYYQAKGGDCSTAGLSSGGDGNYFNGTNYVAADVGVANTGGGGGGGSYNSGGGFAGAAGGSGLVALYYVPGAGEITLSQPDAMSYSSTANTTSVTLTKTSPGSAAWTTSNQTICTVTGNDSGATVTVLIAGVCAVSVTVAASGGFSTGSAEVNFRIDKITQTAPGWDSATATVAFGSSLDLYEKLASPSGVANYSFTATGTGCAVTGVMLTVGDAGSNCSVTPTINGTDIYLPATGTALTVSVTKISQSALVLTSATSMDVDQTLTLSAAGGSGDGALSYIVANQGTTGCVANPTTGALTATGAGQCEVYAQRALSDNYDAVTSSHVIVTINKVAQNLSWVSQPQAQYVAGNTYALEATASSQLAVAYSISSGLCTLAGSTVTFTGSGDCVIQAGQAGDNSFLAAVTISQTVSVGKINQTMTFSALANVSWGSLAFSLSATASSGLNIVYTENNQTTNDACDVSANGIVTIKHVGTCAITATQAGNSAYTAVTTTRLFEVTANQAGAPFIGSVSFGDRQLNASFFTPSYLGGGTVSAYELQAHPLGGGAVVKNTGCIPQQGPNQTCSVIGLTNGVTYELKVAAITQAGLGQLSASSSEVTPAANPEAVGNLVAIEGNGTLTLQWTPPTNLGGGTFDQYRIFWRAPGGSYRAVNSPNAFVATQSSTTYVITGLDNGVAYDVKVITTSTVNSAELQSNTAEVRQTPYTVPDAPAAVVALDNDNNVVVAWQAPIFDGGNPIDQYVVEKDGTAVCTITSATTTSCEVEKPSPGNTSVIEVRAGNDAGLSAPVSTSVTVAALPGSNPPGLIGGGSFPGVTPGAIAPIVLDVSGSATVKTNEVVRLVGTNFNLIEKVLIGDVEASFFVNSSQLITIRVPIDVAPGNPAITLQGAFGTAIFTGLIQVSVTQVSVDTKVTIGTFLGYAAVYTKNHEGKRLSMKIGNKWRVIDPLDANYTYSYTKVGVGRTVTVEVYIDRVLVQVKQIKIQ